MSEKVSTNEELLAIEEALRTRLNPVRPNQKFVSNLRQRLVESPAYQQRQQKAAKLLTVAGGLMFGLVVFLIGRRLIEGSEST